MRRKIPVRKHHGVRDPLKQLELKEALVKDKINNPPERRDHQKVSSKFAKFVELKTQAKEGTFKLKRYVDNEDTPENAPAKHKAKYNTQEKKVDKIKKVANETNRDYMKRVYRITQRCTQEAEFENKYGVSVIRNPKTGEICLKKRPKNEIDELMKKNAAAQSGGGKNKKKKPEIRITNEEKRKLVKEMYKQKKEKAIAAIEDIKDFKKDEFTFGEVVHGPPVALTVPRLARKAETVPRPGQKDLILRSLMPKKEVSSSKVVGVNGVQKIGVTKKKKKTKMGAKEVKIDLTMKRKDLPASTRKMLENQQRDVVEMYRNMKKNKMQSSQS